MSLGRNIASSQVYKTSIVSSSGKLEPVRPANVVAPSILIEIIHVVVFLILGYVILGRTWLKAKS